MFDVQAVPMMFITSSQSVANIHSYRKQQLGRGIYKIHFYQFHDLLSFFHDTKLPYDRKAPLKIKCILQGCNVISSDTLPQNSEGFCKIYYSHFIFEVITFLSKIQNHSKKLSNYGSFSKIRRKNHYLEKLNSKNGRKFYYSQNLCFDRIFSWKEYDFPSGFLTNTILNFAQEWHLFLGSFLFSTCSSHVFTNSELST